MSFLLLASLAYIWYVAVKKGSLSIDDKYGILCKAVILLGGIFSVFFGIDMGESMHGVLRLCAYLAAGIASMQVSVENKRRILITLPVLGILFSVCSLFRKCDIFKFWIATETGRLAGPFEYPNTMALFLLIGVVVSEQLWKRGKHIIQFLLIICVMATGSRTVFAALCVYLFYCFIRHRGKNKGFIMLMAAAGLIIFTANICSQDLYGFGRFMTVGINSSTLQGRLLYWEDALKMLVKHPLGLGYMGYFYLQQAEQTGVYSVRYVHNEWLQWLLDYGILAGAGAVFYIVRQLRLNKMGAAEKELLCIIAACSFFDFHLQFISIVCIVALLFPKERICRGKRLQSLRIAAAVGMFAAAVLVTADVTARHLARQGDYGQAVLWNPLSAQYKQEYLLQSKDLDSAEIYADRLLKDNKYLYAAYMIKSNAAANKGQAGLFIENRKQALRLRKYKTEEYEDYFRILLSLYLQADTDNNVEVMEQCKNAMKEIPKIITKVKKQTSVRAYRIQQKPELYFNKEYEKIINAL